MNASVSWRESLNGAAEPGRDLLEIDVFDGTISVRAKNRCNASRVCSQNTVEVFLLALWGSVLTVRRSPCSVVEVPCVPSTVRRSRCPENVLPKPPRYIVGNPGAASSSGRLETETQA